MNLSISINLFMIINMKALLTILTILFLCSELYAQYPNTVLGLNAGESLTNVASGNTLIGGNAGKHTTDGKLNVFMGNYAGLANINGQKNVYLGFMAGNANQHGSNNILIGYRAGYTEPSLDNRLHINVSGNGQRPLIYGEFDNYKVGIDTKIIPDGYKFAVSGKGIFKETLKITSHSQGRAAKLYLDNTFIGTHIHNGDTLFMIKTKDDNSILGAYLGKDALYLGSDDPCFKSYPVESILNIDGGIYVEGNAYSGSGSAMFTIASDRRMKKNLSLLEAKTSLAILSSIKIYDFEYKGSGIKRYGIVAQEMQKILPRTVNTFEKSGSEFYNFNPNDLFYLHINATQELSRIVSIQGKTIEQLKKEIRLLKTTSETKEERLEEALQRLKTKEDKIDKALQSLAVKESKIDELLQKLETKENKLDQALQSFEAKENKCNEAVQTSQNTKNKLSVVEGKLNSLETKVQGLVQQFKDFLNSFYPPKTQNPSTKSANNQAEDLTKQSRLAQNIPNPTTNATTIAYDLPEEITNAYLHLFNNAGQTIQKYPLGTECTGSITIQLKDFQLKGGVYYYELVVDGKSVDSKKLVLIQ